MNENVKRITRNVNENVKIVTRNVNENGKRERESLEM